MPIKFIDEFEEEFTCYAIQSNGMDETKFIFNFNKITEKKFDRVNDLDVNLRGQEFCFSLYTFFDEINEIDYYIIKNQSHKIKSSSDQNLLFDSIEESEYILNRFKRYDYIVKIPFIDEPVFLNELTLQQFDFIQNINILDNLTQKEKNLLSL